ncbi:hypothetical protein ACE6H2_011076 [Prunus campanulata]
MHIAELYVEDDCYVVTKTAGVNALLFKLYGLYEACFVSNPTQSGSSCGTPSMVSNQTQSGSSSQSSNFGVLAAIARDVLAIPVSTVASESTFSTGGRTINSFRSSLSLAMVEALICTHNWLKSTSISLEVEPTIEEMEFYETIESEIKKSNAMGPLHISCDWERK